MMSESEWPIVRIGPDDLLPGGELPDLWRRRVILYGGADPVRSGHLRRGAGMDVWSGDDIPDQSDQRPVLWGVDA